MDRYFWRILLIDDDEDDYVIVRKMLSEVRHGKITLIWASSFDEGRERINTEALYDAVLVDYDMGANKGTELIREAINHGCPAPFILLTGQGSYEVDIEAMEAGALDYLAKNEVTASLLERAIRYAIEQKKSEEKIRQGEVFLRESRQELNDILESINDGFFAFDREWRYIYINQRAAEPLGYKPEELIGKNLWEVFPKMHGTAAEKHYREAMEEGIASQYIIQGAYSQRWYQISVYPSKNGISVFSIDITANKHAEQALEESERRFRVALANAQIAVFSTDQDLRYNWFYSAFMKNIQKKFIGKRDDEILPADSVAELMEIKRAAMTERKAFRQEIRLQIPSDVRHIIVSVEPYLNPEGELMGVIGTYLDITEQRRLEAENIAHLTQVEVQRRLLEYREKERQEIARDLHDGPVQDLSSLIFNLQYTKESIHEPSTQTELDQIGLNLKSVVHDLRGMINELRPPSLIRFGLAKAVQFHLEDFKEKHPEIGLEFTIVDDGNRLSEQARLNLFRILQEAMNNAVNHAHATALDIHFDCNDQRAVLEIRDNGKGFPISKKLVDYTTEGHFGLVGMKERAEALQGTFTISSEPNAGTLVQVTIPLTSHE